MKKQSRRDVPVDQDVNVLALVKGKEKYVFLYSDEYRADMLRMLGQYASDPELSFSWYDAAVLSQKIRREEQCRNITALRRTKVAVSSDVDQ